MKVDFHHAVTYVVARHAGFSPEEAATVAYSAAYVDDATNSGTIRFENGAMYSRRSSAHRMIDYRNLQEVLNHSVWIPFHFLPGNGGCAAGDHPTGSFIQKLVCYPDSPVAHDMLEAACARKDTRSGLYRLGIAMHVLADTWAHQGFTGVIHDINDVSHIRCDGEDLDAPILNRWKRWVQWMQKGWGRLKSGFAGEVLPLGHAAVLDYPDTPFLRWSYRSHAGEWVYCDNVSRFVEAAEGMCRAMQRYRMGDMQANVSGLLPPLRSALQDCFTQFISEDAEVRHLLWLQKIGEGAFGLKPEALEYIPKGLGSWKHGALGQVDAVDYETDCFQYDPDFLSSDWKAFHDALVMHREVLVRQILPRYGICIA